jgi:hypothetical protein
MTGLRIGGRDGTTARASTTVAHVATTDHR